MASAALKLITPLQSVKGVGPARVKVLEQNDITTIADLLYYFPRRHLDRTTVTACNNLKKDNQATVVGTVKSSGIKTLRRGKLFQVLLEDGTGFVTLTWFNGIKYIKNSFKINDRIAVHGKVEYYRGFQMVHPEYDKLDSDSDPLSSGAVIPLYPLNQSFKKARLDHRSLRKFIRDIQNKIELISDFYNADFLSMHNLISRDKALKAIHFAKNIDQLDSAKRRLKFDEHFFLQLGVALKKESLEKIGAKPLNKSGDYAKTIYGLLDYELTTAQKRVIKEIADDIKKPMMMNRLLQGDVGSGKTIIAILAAALAVDNGVQVAIMAPTEILAHQLYNVFRKFTDDAKIPTALLVGNTSTKDRQTILNGLRNGGIKIIIGTHALIQKDVDFKKLGLVIVDEQHRFGVMQRGYLIKKGENPHFLAMTATPIPRTLSITYYGDMELSIIDEMPKERIPVTTTIIEPERLNKVYNFVEEEIKKGKQCMIVYPLVEESEKSDLSAAVEGYEYLKKNVFSKYNIRLIHGRMKKDEKDSIMNDFATNKINVLVSTTVIEVGIDVPNSTVMIVEHAERFGLTQLHQLRGRVGRGDKKSYCILVERNTTDTSSKRLKIVANTTDGFEIADEDLKMRGPGVFFGIQQSGFFKFKIANLIADGEIIRESRKAAFELVNADPQLSDPKNANIKKHFIENYQYLLKEMTVG